MENYLVLKKMKFWFMSLHALVLEHYAIWNKVDTQLQCLWFHLYELPVLVKHIDAKVIPKDAGDEGIGSFI